MIEPGPAETPDAKLVAEAKAGDAQAFGVLYERYVTQIFRYIRSRVSAERDAEDLTETVFMRSFESLDSYEERGHPYSSFLYQVARNVLVDHYRQSDDERPLEDAEPLPAPTTDPELSIQEEEEVAKIKQAMEALPDDYQEVIRLRVLMSLPTSTAADWLDRSDGAVRVLLYRALNSLREKLEIERDG